jgi:cytochrome c-type protein NapC
LTEHASLLSVVSLSCAAVAAVLLVVFLVSAPPLTTATRLLLLLGLGVFPIAAAGAGNVQGYETTKSRAFCGSCHVMTPYTEDSRDHTSRSLASRHARNKLFGDENCYACHADYGMYGTVTTKIGGLRHVYLYFTEYRDVSLERAKETIHLRKPFSNTTCMQCHSTELAVWNANPEHQASLGDVRAGRLSCASGGCHGYAHPFTKVGVPVLPPAAASSRPAGAPAPSYPSGAPAPCEARP